MGFISALLLAVIALLGGLIFWATAFEIDRVVRGNGVLVYKTSNRCFWGDFEVFCKTR